MEFNNKTQITNNFGANIYSCKNVLTLKSDEQTKANEMKLKDEVINQREIVDMYMNQVSIKNHGSNDFANSIFHNDSKAEQNGELSVNQFDQMMEQRQQRIIEQSLRTIDKKNFLLSLLEKQKMNKLSAEILKVNTFA